MFSESWNISLIKQWTVALCTTGVVFHQAVALCTHQSPVWRWQWTVALCTTGVVFHRAVALCTHQSLVWTWVLSGLWAGILVSYAWSAEGQNVPGHCFSCQYHSL